MRRNSKKQQGAFHKNLEIITKRRIESMPILDSEKHIRFLQDPSTGFYIVFDGRFNQSYYAKSYQAAEAKFKYLVSLRDRLLLRELDNWKLFKEGERYLVVSPQGWSQRFESQHEAEKFMLLEFYKNLNCLGQ